MPTNSQLKRLNLKLDIVEKHENRVHKLTDSNGARGQWRDPKAMAVGPGHGIAGDGRKSETRHAAMTACSRAIFVRLRQPESSACHARAHDKAIWAFDYASGDGCGFS